MPEYLRITQRTILQRIARITFTLAENLIVTRTSDYRIALIFYPRASFIKAVCNTLTLTRSYVVYLKP